MELWIRSQDRNTFMKITRLYIFRNAIFSVDTRENEIILGAYKKDKRALEVLDEIQERILNLQLVSLEEKGKARQDVRITPYLECVYEMPKK